MQAPTNQDSIQALMMQRAAPALRAIQIKVAEEFNKALVIFVRRLIQWFPQAEIELRAALTTLSTVVDSEMFMMPLEEWDTVITGQSKQLTECNDEFITQCATRVFKSRQLAEIWKTAPQDVRRRVWGHILKLSNIVHRFREMERNKEQIFREAFAKAQQVVDSIDQRPGQPLSIEDVAKQMGLPFH